MQSRKRAPEDRNNAIDDHLMALIQAQPRSLDELLCCGTAHFAPSEISAGIQATLKSLIALGFVGVRELPPACFFWLASSASPASSSACVTPLTPSRRARLSGPPIVFKDSPRQRSPVQGLVPRRGGLTTPPRATDAIAEIGALPASLLAPSAPRAAADGGTDDDALRKEEHELDVLIERLKRPAEPNRQALEKMEALHVYNDVKDAAQSILGQLAIWEGTTTRKLYPRFELNVDD